MRAQSRLASTLPQRVDLYFERRPIRRYLCVTCGAAASVQHVLTRHWRTRWCGISGFAGFYVANTVSLSFGALAVNDVIAAALSVTFVELVTRAFYTAWPNPCVCGCAAALARARAEHARRAGPSRCGFCTASRCAAVPCAPRFTRRLLTPRATRQLGFVYALVSDSFKLGG